MAESVLLCAFFDDEKPIILYTNHHNQAANKVLDLYTDIAYILDPFYLVFKEKMGDQIIHLRDIAPDNFKRSEYYKKFYEAIQLKDECGLLVHMSEKSALFFSFGTQEKGKRINPARLNVAFDLLISMAKRHWTTLSPDRTSGSGRLPAHLKSAFEKFGTSILSPREGEIARLILQGHSSKSIARLLGNSPETIKVHRRRVYVKLRVTSQGELLSLFLAALESTPATSNNDPLVHFFNKN